MTIDIKCLRYLRAVGTPGEWRAWEITGSVRPGPYQCRDAALIAAAVNALPELCDAAEERDALRAEVERLRHESKYDTGYADATAAHESVDALLDAARVFISAADAHVANLEARLCDAAEERDALRARVVVAEMTADEYQKARRVTTEDTR